MLAYSVAVDSPPNLVIRADRGRGAERRLTKNGNEQQYANSFTPDGKLLVFHAITATTGTDLYVVDLTQESATPQRLLQTRANEHSGRVSPDGRWMAYVSDESGQPEVYIARFPELQGAVRVSSGGGSRPSWRRDGNELFFLAPGGRMMALAIASTNTAVNPGAPAELFRSVFYGDVYAPDPTGQRFLTARPTASSDIVPLEIITAPFR
jgi:Tol biopolymer transport system component